MVGLPSGGEHLPASSRMNLALTPFGYVTKSYAQGRELLMLQKWQRAVSKCDDCRYRPSGAIACNTGEPPSKHNVAEGDIRRMRNSAPVFSIGWQQLKESV
jgi:hypothetical protein